MAIKATTAAAVMGGGGNDSGAIWLEVGKGPASLTSGPRLLVGLGALVGRAELVAAARGMGVGCYAARALLG